MEDKDLIFRLHITGRYFEDCDIDGEQDNELTNETTPNVCGFDKDKREVIWDIEVNTGKIRNWNGQVVDTYYKQVDEGVYELVVGDKVISRKDSCYVPDFLGIEDASYGDYIYLHIESDGQIRYWDINTYPGYVCKFFGVINNKADLDFYIDEEIDFKDCVVISKSGNAKNVEDIITDFINNN